MIIVRNWMKRVSAISLVSYLVSSTPFKILLVMSYIVLEKFYLVFGQILINFIEQERLINDLRLRDDARNAEYKV